MEILREIVDDICALSGVAMAIADADRTFLYANVESSYEFCTLLQSTPCGQERCRECDMQMCKEAERLRRPFSHLCHAGLFDTGMPILKGEVTVGYIIFGRVRDRHELDEATLTALVGYGLSREALLEKYRKTPYLSKKRRDSLLRLLTHVLFAPAIEIEYDSFIARATHYIDTHLSEPLTVEELCAALFVSKNDLYKSFHSFFGKTVNAYVTARRIRLAEDLLSTTDKGIREIAETVGIENYTYFIRLFKKMTGYSPGRYRKRPR
jgi:AraC-like DNA-binding protein